MGYNRRYLILIFSFLIIGLTPLAFAQGEPPPQACQGNPEPEPITILSAIVLDSNTVRIAFEQSLCSTEFQIQRSDNGGAFIIIVNIDRTFDVETFRPDAVNPVTFYLDSATNPEDQYDYRILAKTQTKEANSFSPIVTVFMPPVGTSRIMASQGFAILSTTTTPILIDYIEGSTPLQNLLFEYLKDFDLISLFIQWAFASHGLDTWTSDSDPQNQAQLFLIEPTPTPITGNLYCFPYLDILFINDQSGGQTIDFTVTLLDYPTIIHQETFNSGMANRYHVASYLLTETEEAIIQDYTNIYVQINAQGETGLPPPNDRSLIIHEMVFYVPEDQGACFS